MQESDIPAYITCGYLKPSVRCGDLAGPAITTARCVARGVVADVISGCFVGVVAGVALPLWLRGTRADETDPGGFIDSKAGLTKDRSSVGPNIEL